MFAITISKLGVDADYCTYSTTLETLADAELVAQARAEELFALKPIELVYIDDLDYYLEIGNSRIGRLSIKPIYQKQETRK